MARTYPTVTTLATAPPVVIPVAKATVINWVQQPPPNVVTGTSFTVQVFLMCPSDLRPPLSGKEVRLVRSDGVIWATRTDENGQAKWIETIKTAGTYEYYAEFLGDAEYLGCGREAYFWQERIRRLRR